jgi:phosphoglycerate dehydrogenase-like enzyme
MEVLVKAILHYRASPGFRKRLSDLTPEWLSIVVVNEDDWDALDKEIGDADVLLHVLEPVTAAMIEAAPKLRLIQKIGVGVNTIDLDAASKNHVAVTNMPGTNSQAVAEMTLTLMLSILRRVVSLDRETRAGKGWSLSDDVIDSMGEINGSTVGLVGYGEVPKRLAPALRALGAKIIYSSRRPVLGIEKDHRTLDALLAEADIVSLHLPETNETKGLINDKTMNQMRRGSILINTARGGLVDELALIRALKSGQIRAAGLDTLSVEPAPSEHPLFSLDNVVITPHLAWLTPETLARSLNIAIDNCDHLRQGRTLVNEITKL